MVINDALLLIRILNGGVVIGDKIALKLILEIRPILAFIEDLPV